MYKNKNYEWLEHYDIENSFVMPGSRSIYFLRLYNKLMSQGTQEDKYRLVELYNESKDGVWDSHEHWIANIMYSISDFFFSANHYEYACKKFIRETNYAHFDDTMERKLEIDNINCDKKIHELEVKIKGYDVQEKQIDEKMIEMRLDSEHTVEQNTGIRDEKYHLPIPPTMEETLNSRIIKSGELNVNDLNKIVPIHYRIYDKVHGYYMVIVWADNRPKDKNGKQFAAIRYTQTYAGVCGAVALMDELVEHEKLNVMAHHYDMKSLEQITEEINERRKVLETKTVNTNNNKKPNMPKIDISKINKALGLENTDE